jgi:hypothetical protein
MTKKMSFEVNINHKSVHRIQSFIFDNKKDTDFLLGTFSSTNPRVMIKKKQQFTNAI